MTDDRSTPTSSPRPDGGPGAADQFEGRLQRDGARYHDLRAEWVPDPADVARRSHRQHQRGRRAATAGLVVVVLLGIGGLFLRSTGRTDEQSLELGGQGTTVPTTPQQAPGTTTAVGTAPSSIPPTTPPVAPSTAPPTPPPTAPPTAPSTVPPPTTAIPAPTVPVTSTVASSVVSLRGDGLGVVSFGDSETHVMTQLIARYGLPTLDSGWREDATSIEPRSNRAVFWEGLQVSFLENERGRYFASWRYSTVNELPRRPGGTPVLSTPEGLTAGLRYGDIAARLGSVTTVWGEGADGYRVATASGPVYIWFDPPQYTLTEPPPADATIVILDAGDPMSVHGP